jgi:hypothetical protein
MPMAKTIRPVHPNAGIEIDYKKRLDALVLEMSKSVYYWVGVWYNASPPAVAIALDASPVREILTKLMRLMKSWIKKFSLFADKYAPKMADEILVTSDNSYKNALKDAGMPTVKFKMTRAQQDVMASVIEENVSLIQSIPKEYLSDVTTIVTQGFSAGRDGSFIKNQLMQKYGITKRRAEFIARDQCNKATAAFNRVRQIEIGITEAIWVHSGAGRHPRPDHVAASGKKYDVAEGCLISGKYILPGQLPNCRCISRSIIPGFEDL